VTQKPTKRGVNRHFQAKLPKSKNCNTSETIHPISPIFDVFDDETHTIKQLHVVGGPPLPYRKYNMADVRHLQNGHNVIARPPNVQSHEFWYVDAK